MILTGNDCDHFDQILNSLHFPRFPLWLLTFYLLLSFFLIRVFCSLPFLALFLVLIDDRRLLSIKIKLGLNRCLSQGTKAVSQLLDAKIQHFGIISGYSGHGNFRSKSFGDAMFLQNLRVSTKFLLYCYWSFCLNVLDNSYKSSNHFHTGITSIFLSFTIISSSNS